jgi:hypothetical protein
MENKENLTLDLSINEELAVVTQRIRKHLRSIKVEKVKIRLELAEALINEAVIYNRE